MNARLSYHAGVIERRVSHCERQRLDRPRLCGRRHFAFPDAAALFARRAPYKDYPPSRPGRVLQASPPTQGSTPLAIHHAHVPDAIRRHTVDHELQRTLGQRRPGSRGQAMKSVDEVLRRHAEGPARLAGTERSGRDINPMDGEELQPWWRDSMPCRPRSSSGQSSRLSTSRCLRHRARQLSSHPAARRSSTSLATSSQISADSNRSCLTAGSIDASASSRYSTACSRR
jgi:hypothetical protein